MDSKEVYDMTDAIYWLTYYRDTFDNGPPTSDMIKNPLSYGIPSTLIRRGTQIKKLGEYLIDVGERNRNAK